MFLTIHTIPPCINAGLPMPPKSPFKKARDYIFGEDNTDPPKTPKSPYERANDCFFRNEVTDESTSNTKSRKASTKNKGKKGAPPARPKYDRSAKTKMGNM